jgi:histidinol phosphatase-like enzyme (inositol monophosphatase family)
MNEPNLKDLLAVAMDAARAGGLHTLKYFGSKLEVSYKSDESPVTRADIESEGKIRDVIAKHYPQHPVLGEESGQSAGSDSRIRWIIDPLDGTKSFVLGVPLYGVLVGLEIDGRPAVGAAYLPATDEMIAAADGLGCKLNGKSVHVSTVATLEDATVLTTNFARCAARMSNFTDVITRASMAAGWGDAYGHMMVATGRADILIDPRTSPWDIAALVPILREAGGRLTSWDGRDTLDAGDALATNGRLHPAMVAALKDAKPDGSHIR